MSAQKWSGCNQIMRDYGRFLDAWHACEDDGKQGQYSTGTTVERLCVQHAFCEIQNQSLAMMGGSQTETPGVVEIKLEDFFHAVIVEYIDSR